MPRLTNPRYLRLHHILKGQWFTDPRSFSLITANEQWDIHAYFQPHKHLTDAELLEHRKQVTAADPSLPHRAGRALRQLIENVRQAEAQANATLAPKRVGGRGIKNTAAIRIHPLVQSEIDVQKLARAMIGLAEWQLKEEKSKASEDTPKAKSG